MLDVRYMQPAPSIQPPAFLTAYNNAATDSRNAASDFSYLSFILLIFPILTGTLCRYGWKCIIPLKPAYLNKHCISLLFLFAATTGLRAGEVPGRISRTDTIPAQNIFVRTDQDLYVAGEQVWMKAWIYSPLVGMPVSSSVYIDLSDRKGQLVAFGKFAVFENMASASFHLPGNLAQDVYLLRAYTSWSLRCGQVFKKPLYVYNRSADQPTGNKKGPVYACSFYPESGRLIENTSNKVAFKLQGYDPGFKMGFAEIVNKEGRISGRVAAFKENRGIFNVVPRHGQQLFLRVKLKDSIFHTYPLPESYKTGLVLHIENSGFDKKFILSRNLQDTARYDSLVLKGFMHHQEVLRTVLNMEGGNDIAGLIRTATVPEGILLLKLYDKDNTLIAQRPVYMRREEELEEITKGLTIDQITRTGYKITMTLPDSICGTFSALVRKTRDTGYLAINNNLVQGLLAEPYLEQVPVSGRRPEYAGADGDMAVLTEHWGSGTQYCTIPDADTAWLSIRGKIDHPLDKIRTMPDEVTWIVMTKDSARTVLSSPVSKKGEFELTGLYFEDTAVFHYQFNAKRPVQKGLPVMIDKITEPRPAPITDAEYASLFDASAPGAYQPGLDSSLLSAVQSYFDIDKEKGLLLQEVIVKAKKLTPEQEVNQRYTSGLFSTMGVARTIDLENNPDASGAMNVFEYLKGKMPGLRIGRYNNGKYYIESPRSYSSLDVLQGGNGLVDGLIYVNEIETGSEVAANYSMNQIALIKFFPPGAMMAMPGVGISCVLAIYTRNGSGKNEPDPRTFMGSFKVKGYDAPESFSRKAPVAGDHSKDMSRTLHWDPSLVLTGQKNISIDFTDSEYPGVIELILEGVTCDGKIIQYKKQVEKKP